MKRFQAFRKYFEMRLAERMRLVGLALLFIAPAVKEAPGSLFTDSEGEAIDAFLQESVARGKSAIVVGLVDEAGTKVFSAGTLDNGDERKPDGNSVFFIGSVSKTFTTLLLLEMAGRGEAPLDDPVAKHLPASVTLPMFDGQEIKLVDLATQSSGLPFDADNMTGADGREEYESYTIEQMYAFLGDYELDHKPGTEFAYSNVGMALLGHALERRAGVSFETLVIERICRPLGMDSTCITLTPELTARRAMGRDEEGNPSPPWKLQAYHQAGDIHSTANDLLKYAAAHAGLRRSALMPLIEQSHVIRFVDARRVPSNGIYMLMGRTAMPWVDRNAVQPPGMELLAHAGGAGSYHAWVGFDKLQQRGVVVLSTANDLSVEAIGWTILQRLPLTAERRLTFARELIGIGAALALDDQTRLLRITAVIPQSPAAEAGLAAGSVIQKIDETPVAGRSLTECVDLIRGPVGTTVRLEVVDSDGKQNRIVELTRRKFKT